VEPGSGLSQTLAGELARLSERCLRVGDLADRQALLARAQELTRDLRASLSRDDEAAARCGTVASPTLAVGSLGRFKVVRGGRTLAPCSACKSIAVFRYLLTRTDRAAHKAELADVMWPGAAPKDAAHSLHVAVSTLRRYLDAGPASYLVFTAGTYRVNPAAEVTDDAEAFQANVTSADRLWRDGDERSVEGAYARAVDSYSGDYCLDNLDFTWADCERERHLSRYLTALYRLGRVRLKQRRYEAAAECLAMVVDRDSYREDVHFQLMICYCRLGRRWQAIQQYLRCQDLLRTSLSLAPAPKLNAFYEAILDSRENSLGLGTWEDDVGPITASAVSGG
jgi:DNA-binding SARP family transcriptional activator